MPEAYASATTPTDVRSTAAAAAVDSRYRWVIVALLLFAVTTAYFDRINIAVLFTNADFKNTIGIGNNPALLGLLMTAFVFAYGLSAVFLSVVSDMMGPRRTLSVIALVLAVVMAVMGGAVSYAAMLAGRIVLGIAEGPMFGTANVAVKQWFPPEQRGFATALWSVGAPIGSMIGFPLVIWLVATYEWRASFYILGALNGLLVLPIVWFFLKDRNTAARGPLKKVETGADAVTYTEAFKILVRNRYFWLLSLYDCGAMIFLWGFNSWLPAYLQEARHFDVKHSSLFSALPFALMVGGFLLGGWLGDRFRKKALICVLGLMAAGLFILGAGLVENAIHAALLLAFAAGAWGMTVPTLFATGTEIIPPKVTAMGFGIYAGIANIVGATAPFVMGLLIGKDGNYFAGLMVMVVCCIGCSVALVPLVRKH